MTPRGWLLPTPTYLIAQVFHRKLIGASRSSPSSVATCHTRTEGTDGRVSRVDRGMCDVLTPAGTVRARWGPKVWRQRSRLLSPRPRSATRCFSRTRVTRSGSPASCRDATPWRGRQCRQVAVTSKYWPPTSTSSRSASHATRHPAAGRIERLLALAWECGSHPAVLLTKSDLSADIDGIEEEVSELAIGASVIPVSIPQTRGWTPSARSPSQGKPSLSSAPRGQASRRS